MTRGMPGGLATALILMTAAAPLPATAATNHREGCFYTRDWENWSAPGAGDILYFRVARHDVYRVELSPGSKVRKDPSSILVTRNRGGDSWICRALDLDMVVSDQHGMQQPLIARSLHKLTTEEIAAIPAKDLP